MVLKQQNLLKFLKVAVRCPESLPTAHSPVVPSLTNHQKSYDLKGQSRKAAITERLMERVVW